MSFRVKIMIRAVRIRMANSEALEDILASYPRLTQDEKNQIRKELGYESKVTI